MIRIYIRITGVHTRAPELWDGVVHRFTSGQVIASECPDWTAMQVGSSA